MIKKNNSELAEYINTLSKITEINKDKLQELILNISDIEKNLSNIKATKAISGLISKGHPDAFFRVISFTLYSSSGSSS